MNDQLTLGLGAVASTPQAPTTKGTRIPADIIPRLRADRVFCDWLRAQCPDVDWPYEMDQFIDYWKGKSGKDATKRDWTATARRWMRTAQQQAGRPRQSAAVNGGQPRRARHADYHADQSVYDE